MVCIFKWSGLLFQIARWRSDNSARLKWYSEGMQRLPAANEMVYAWNMSRVYHCSSSWCHTMSVCPYAFRTDGRTWPILCPSIRFQLFWYDSYQIKFKEVLHSLSQCVRAPTFDNLVYFERHYVRKRPAAAPSINTLDNTFWCSNNIQRIPIARTETMAEERVEKQMNFMRFASQTLRSYHGDAFTLPAFLNGISTLKTMSGGTYALRKFGRGNF